MMLGFTFYRHDIGDYMARWILVHPWGTVRLHRISRADADPEMHTHPFDFVSFIFSGGYVEQLPVDGPLGPCRYVRRRAPAINVCRGAAPHRLHSILGACAWTLVFTTRRKRSWGFWTARGWVSWRDFVNAKNVDVDAYAATIRKVYGGES